ncbi:MAG TPA: TatD family hydrolase [Spirochaetia bacterium]|nr:TatD family hydrolase [Spirochaetia bacterium]
MNEFPGLVDSHLHLLSLAQKGLDPVGCLAELFEAGGRWALDVAVDAHDWELRLGWGAQEPRLWYTAGIHPSEAHRTDASDLTAVAQQLEHPRCRAVGEIGLDWYRGRGDETAQRELFRAQLHLAGERNLPVVIHNREADRELLEDLDAVSWAGTGIQHCFSSDRSFARAALDRGFSLSFAGNLTYPSAANLRDVAAWAPLDRVLVETDAPFLAPQPVRGKPNRPVHAGHTARFLADLRGLPLEDVLVATGENFARLMGLA